MEASKPPLPFWEHGLRRRLRREEKWSDWWTPGNHKPIVTALNIPSAINAAFAVCRWPTASNVEKIRQLGHESLLFQPFLFLVFSGVLDLFVELVLEFMWTICESLEFMKSVDRVSPKKGSHTPPSVHSLSGHNLSMGLRFRVPSKDDSSSTHVKVRN